MHSSHLGFFVWAATAFSGAFPPRPSSGTSPRPLQLLPTARLPAGSWWGNLAKPLLTGCRGRRPSRSLVEAEADSGRRCLDCSVVGKCLRPRRFRIPEQTPLLFLHLRPRPPPTKPDGHRAWPQSPKAGPGRGAGGESKARGAEPAPSPSPIGGARPRGREQGGEMGSSPPQPLPFLRPA